jgi:hypothetical protein
MEEKCKDCINFETEDINGTYCSLLGEDKDELEEGCSDFAPK